MKIIKNLFLALILISILCVELIAQNIGVHFMIGKKTSEVVRQYGEPVHQDKSNPAMICMFYKGDNSTITFVGDKDGVYQAELNKSYDKENDARSAADNMISKSINNGFECDTVSTNDFQLTKPGVKATIQLNNNKITKKTDLNIKAKETEG